MKAMHGFTRIEIDSTLTVVDLDAVKTLNAGPGRAIHRLLLNGCSKL